MGHEWDLSKEPFTHAGKAIGFPGGLVSFKRRAPAVATGRARSLSRLMARPQGPHKGGWNGCLSNSA